ncbi:unannotated protein [freshwater metagenome]|uniref:Unannotated protein n=1 Tax=freshwater metagenome TaxID=449393 RepID=A0A6J7E8N5_9ZZZZ|nr:hypothetical protein [Actinomycetota bacterium]
MHLKELIRALKPHKTIPVTPWRANSLWDLSLTRVGILFFGLIIFGFGDAFVVQSNLGNAPWTVFAEGISQRSGISLGLATGLISIAVMLFWIPLKVKPGFGTLSNIVLIAIAIQIGVTYFPLQHSLISGIASAIFGVALVGFGSSLYLTCALGPGPRDGTMTGLHRVTGVRVGRVRLGIEVLVMSVGAGLGGRIGLGTAIFALFIGQSIAIFLGLVARLTKSPTA